MSRSENVPKTDFLCSEFTKAFAIFNNENSVDFSL